MAIPLFREGDLLANLVFFHVQLGKQISNNAGAHDKDKACATKARVVSILKLFLCGILRLPGCLPGSPGPHCCCTESEDSSDLNSET